MNKLMRFVAEFFVTAPANTVSTPTRQEKGAEQDHKRKVESARQTLMDKRAERAKRTEQAAREEWPQTQFIA